jgi:membrane-bound lytic murein transglycosylase A
LVFVALVFTGCKKQAVAPDYARPLGPGEHALRKLAPEEWPDFSTALARRDVALIQAMDRSLSWYVKPSTRKFFPVNDITHEQAHASVFRLRQLLNTTASPQELTSALRQEFDVWQSIGWDRKGTVLYTGYFSPIFEASAVQTSEFTHPLYRRPADLVSDPVTGEVQGQRVGDQTVSYPRRKAIEQSQMMAGHELVWLREKFDAYIIQVNGSARLQMTDGTVQYIGYAGNNGHDYTSIGKMLVKEGKIEPDQLNLKTIREYFRRRPDMLDHYTQNNDRFVFFQPYTGDQWPAGSLGVKVTAMRSLATDKQIFPRGCVTLVTTRSPAAGGRFEQLMVDQDTGGAIRAAGRADIYMGIGEQAEEMAGRQYAEGQMYYLVLKPANVPPVMQAIQGHAVSSAAPATVH